MEEAHSNYKEMKNKLLEAGTISSDRSLNAVSDDLMSDVAWYDTMFLLGLFYKLRLRCICYNIARSFDSGSRGLNLSPNRGLCVMFLGRLL